MVYTFGSVPVSTGRQQVSSNYVYQTGEFGEVTVQVAEQTSLGLTEKDVAERFVAEMKAKGAEVVYVEVGMVWTYSYFVYHIRAFFHASPITASVILAVLAIIFLVTVIVGAVYWKHEGVSLPSLPTLGESSGLILILLAVSVLLFVLFGGSITKKGIKFRGKH